MNKIIRGDLKAEQVQAANVWSAIPALQTAPLTCCHCEFCEQSMVRFRARLSMQLREGQVSFRTQSSLLRVLTCLRQPKHKFTCGGSGIHIPEIVFFKGGELNAMFCYREEDQSVRMTKKGLTLGLVARTLNERRRKYKEILRKEAPHFEQPATKDSILVTLLTGQTFQLSEHQFLTLANKRKSDPYWQKVATIRNVPGTGNMTSRRYFYLYHRTKEVKSHPLHQRALDLCLSLGGQHGKTDEEYVNSGEQSEFISGLERDEDKVAYSTFKVVLFMLRFNEFKTKEAMFDWVIDEAGNCILLEVTGLAGVELPRYEWNDQVYNRRVVQYAERRLALRDKHMGCGMSRERAQLLERSLYRNFQQMKEESGLWVKEVNVGEEQINDQAYSVLHPEQKRKLSSLLREGATVRALVSDRRQFDERKTKAFNFMTKMVGELSRGGSSRNSTKRGFYTRDTTSACTSRRVCPRSS